MYSSQEIAEKGIGVDTARYYFSVDGRDDELFTGDDGWWGSFEEYYRKNGKNRLSDAAVLSITIPEDYDFGGMKQLAEYFFEELQRLPPQKQKKQEEPAR